MDGYPQNAVEQQSLQGEIAELRAIMMEIKGRVMDMPSGLESPDKNPMAVHKLVNIKNQITDLKMQALDILKAVSLL